MKGCFSPPQDILSVTDALWSEVEIEAAVEEKRGNSPGSEEGLVKGKTPFLRVV